MKTKLLKHGLLAVFLLTTLLPLTVYAENNLFEIDSTVAGEDLSIIWSLSAERDGATTSGIGMQVKFSEYVSPTGNITFKVAESGESVYEKNLSIDKSSEKIEETLSWSEEGGERALTLKIYPQSGYMTLLGVGESVENYSRYKYELIIGIKPSLSAKCYASNIDDWDDEGNFTKYPYTNDNEEKGFNVLSLQDKSRLLYRGEESGEVQIPNTAVKVSLSDIVREITVKREWTGTPPESVKVEAKDQLGETYEYELFGEDTEEHEGGWKASQILPMVRYDEDTGGCHELTYTFTEVNTPAGSSPRIVFLLGKEVVNATETYDTVLITDREEEQAEDPIETTAPSGPNETTTDPTEASDLMDTDDSVESGDTTDSDKSTNYIIEESTGAPSTESRSASESPFEETNSTVGPTEKASETIESGSVKDETKRNESNGPKTGDRSLLPVWLMSVVSIMTLLVIRRKLNG